MGRIGPRYQEAAAGPFDGPDPIATGSQTIHESGVLDAGLSGRPGVFFFDGSTHIRPIGQR
ncbi:MAG: hypothetical protein ACI9MR_003557 [Myxococcota bacterium]|jgi:hypothetical protein